MLTKATITVDLAKITENARRVVDALGGRQVVGITKVTCGSPEVARAMLAGGVSALGDSRLENLAGLRAAGINAPTWLIRSPVPALAEETVRYADVSLESELETVLALDAAAGALGKRHAIVAMVDLGDLREGMMPAGLPAFVDRVGALANVDLLGIGMSLTCYGAIVPDERNLAQLVALTRSAEEHLGRRLLISGGMSSSLDALVGGLLPDRIDSLRVGESILLGVSTVTRERILDLHTDAFVAEVPVIEVMRKPSKPIGTSAQDAFGGRPEFEDRGERLRAICAIGRQDAPPEGLRPLDAGVEVLGASSDHLVLDVDAMTAPPRVGDTLRFVPDYSATLRLFTSPYVRKVFAGAE
ncbi:MAG: alanine/ornithine racemase family PLP-dependent enzyme [Actinobacteria bacterium]|nr:MAG: alanine/ornithine racemase family PLP-dependent enzyme [Actinomycetota bacterium]